MVGRLSSLILAALVAAAPSVHAAQGTARAQSPRGAAKPSVVVNLNTATATELEKLPGIGAKTAARIVEYRQKKGPFKKPEELMNVQGIGEKSFLKLKSQITITGKPESGASQN